MKRYEPGRWLNEARDDVTKLGLSTAMPPTITYVDKMAVNSRRCDWFLRARAGAWVLNRNKLENVRGVALLSDWARLALRDSRVKTVVKEPGRIRRGILISQSKNPNADNTNVLVDNLEVEIPAGSQYIAWDDQHVTKDARNGAPTSQYGAQIRRAGRYRTFRKDKEVLLGDGSRKTTEGELLSPHNKNTNAGQSRRVWWLDTY